MCSRSLLGGWATASGDVKLTAADAAASDEFGRKVAIDGDTIVVSAHRDDDGGSVSGSVYVFNEPSGGWTTNNTSAKLTASDPAVNDEFGWSVAVGGGTVVVGAHQDDDGGSDSGSAYVYEASGWTSVADSAPGGVNAVSFTVAGLSDGERYGFRVRAVNDVGASEASLFLGVLLDVPLRPLGLGGGVGDSEVVLGWHDPANSTITGYEYQLRARIAKLAASDAAADDEFGRSVAIDGDTMVVGARFDDDSGGASGAAYVFALRQGVWKQVAKLTASDGAVGDEFGYSVAVDGDTVVVGARYDDDGASDSGSVYVFTKPAGGWTTVSGNARLTASDAAAGDELGFSVAIDGGLVVAGARGDDAPGSDSGSVYVFVEPAGGWATATHAGKLTASDGAAGDEFGYSVAVDGATVVVGAPYDDDGASGSGSVYVFSEPAAGWGTATGNLKLTASDPDVDDGFGWSVAVDGATVVVGSPYDDEGGSDAGFGVCVH